jgi:hypothetical protein
LIPLLAFFHIYFFYAKTADQHQVQLLSGAFLDDPGNYYRGGAGYNGSRHRRDARHNVGW